MPIISLTYSSFDIFRCAIWINRCGVEHLKSIDPALVNKKYRLCADHFEDTMYANFQKNRLKSDAVPTLFDHKEVFKTVSNKLNTNEFLVKCTGLSEGTMTADNDLSIVSTSSYSMYDASSTSTKVDTSSTCIQTLKFLSDTTPRKVSLRNQLANEVAQRKELESKCNELSNMLAAINSLENSIEIVKPLVTPTLFLLIKSQIDNQNKKK